MFLYCVVIFCISPYMLLNVLNAIFVRDAIILTTMTVILIENITCDNYYFFNKAHYYVGTLPGTIGNPPLLCCTFHETWKEVSATLSVLQQF